MVFARVPTATWTWLAVPGELTEALPSEALLPVGSSVVLTRTDPEIEAASLMMSPWSTNWSWPAPCGLWNDVSMTERNVIVPLTAPLACAAQSASEPAGRMQPPTMFAPKPWSASQVDTLNWIAVVPSPWRTAV